MNIMVDAIVQMENIKHHLVLLNAIRLSIYKKPMMNLQRGLMKLVN